MEKKVEQPRAKQLPAKCIICLEFDQKLCDECSNYHRKYLFMPTPKDLPKYIPKHIHKDEREKHIQRSEQIMPSNFFYWMMPIHQHDNALKKIDKQDNQCLHKGYQEAPKVPSGHSSYISQHWNKWRKQ